MPRVYVSPHRDRLIACQAEVVARYEGGDTCANIARSFNVAEETVRHFLIKCGVKMRRRGAKKAFPLLVDAFETPSEHRDYWLGFLMADGNVWKSTVSVCSHKRDLAHIKLFQNFLGATQDKIVERDNTVTLKVCSIELTKSVSMFGLVPAKSLAAKASNELVDSRHFWRGVIDGDGCLTYGRRSYPHLMLTGSDRLLEQYDDFIERRLKFYPYRASVNGIGRSDLGGQKASQAAALLYEGSTISLPRKRERAADFLEYWRRQKCRAQSGAGALTAPAG